LPSATDASPFKVAMTETASSGLEVANAAIVSPMIPAGTRHHAAIPTDPRTNSSPPMPAATTPRPRVSQSDMACSSSGGYFGR
jgi:hypothetical protein